MKKFLFLALVLAATLPLVARAQSNPPFTNPSLDPNCYFPQIGVPGEIDTIVGDSANAGIGAYIHNLGPQQGGMPGNLLIGNTGPFILGEATDIFSIAPTGSAFNLHNLKAKAQAGLRLDPQSIWFGHFHNSTSVDVLDWTNFYPKIYWADENGDYDSSQYTLLNSNLFGQGNILGGSWFVAYVAPLTSDSIDDIVLGYATHEPIATQDSNYLVLYKGGILLAKKDTAYEDTSANFGPVTRTSGVSSVLQGDFRGTGREDLLVNDEQGNLFFYKNDPPFSLQMFANEMFDDTLAYDFGVYQALVMPVLPKKKGDNSVDLIQGIADTPYTGIANIGIFRGGPDFGSRRITNDSAAYVITPPDLGYQSWPEGFADGGDMTGTGNHVLLTGGGATGSAHYTDLNFYVTGQALDNKIDLFYGNTYSGPWDTLTANSDSLEDLALGNPYYGDSTEGTMGVMYGSKQIPVHLNPQFSVVNVPQVNGVGITFSPNPVTQSWSVATIVWPEAEDAKYAIYDILGRQVDEGPIRILDGPSQQRIYFSNVPQGVYIYTIEGAHGSASAKIVKLSPASNGSGSQPSIIQQMKQARDGKSEPAGFTSPEVLR